MAIREISKYEADDGGIHPIRLATETLAVAGTPPTGAVDRLVSAKVSKSNSEMGKRPRGVTLTRIVGTAPNQFRVRKFLPVLTATAFNSATFAVGATVTINTVDWTVATKRGEDSN